MTRHPAPPVLPAVLLLLLVLAGCARTPPFRQPVEAETPMALTLWRSRLAQKLTPEEWRWFDAVVQEHKLRLMQAGAAGGSAGLDDSVRRQIHGRPLAEVMSEGLQLLRDRKTAELAEMREAHTRNEGKRRFIKENEDLLRDLEFHQTELLRKIARVEADIDATEDAIQSLSAKAAR